MIESFLMGLTLGAAVGSAWLWIRASRVQIPPHTADVGPFIDALRVQAKLNSQAAIFAASAVALQGLSLMVHWLGR
jgi:hypothetical protein